MIYIDAIYYAFVYSSPSPHAGKVKSIKNAISDFRSYKYIKEGTVMRTYLKRTFPKNKSVDPTDTLNFLAEHVQ